MDPSKAPAVVTPRNPGEPSRNLNASSLDTVGAREVLDALADGSYITDDTRRIVFWSRAAERITGWTAHEVVGHRCMDNILVHVDKDGHQLCTEDYCPLHRAMVTGEESQVPVLVFAQHKQGYRIPVEVSVAPLRDRSGRTLGGIEVFRDLTTMMEDLRRAKVIQDHVLQTDLPADARVRFEVSYRPEELVGGDFYRVERLEADTYAVMVADVMGHGVASALYTMQLRSIWEDGQGRLSSPAGFLTEMDRALHRLAQPSGYFATAVCLCLNVATGVLRYVRAAHPAPLVFRNHGTIERLNARCPAIGLVENSSFTETEVQLARGERVLLYTDGATEIANAAGEELGEAGLIKLLQGQPGGPLDLGAIERSLLDYSNNIRLPDDLTLLTIELN